MLDYYFLFLMIIMNAAAGHMFSYDQTSLTYGLPQGRLNEHPFYKIVGLLFLIISLLLPVIYSSWWTVFIVFFGGIVVGRVFFSLFKYFLSLFSILILFISILLTYLNLFL